MYIRRICYSCKHYNSEKTQTCKAFPDGIPRELFKIYLPDDQNAIYHTQPYPGDNGIQYEPIESSPVLNGRDRSLSHSRSLTYITSEKTTLYTLQN